MRFPVTSEHQHGVILTHILVSYRNNFQKKCVSISPRSGAHVGERNLFLSAIRRTYRRPKSACVKKPPRLTPPQGGLEKPRDPARDPPAIGGQGSAIRESQIAGVYNQSIWVHPPPATPRWPAFFLVLAGACQFGTAWWAGLRLNSFIQPEYSAV